MQLLHEDRRHLHRALNLARDAAAFASPNPTVGCVLSSPDGRVIAEGAHRYDTRDHAEIVALKAASAAGKSVKNATAFVTLEPCVHHGRTGPCADALIQAGIGRCVIATQDPNPQVSGRGIEKLRAAGIDVLVLEPADPAAQEARRLNDAFAFSIQHGRPFVTLKAALSVDGKLAPSPELRSARAPVWLTGDAAREDVQRLRHAHDAVMTGVGTVLADDPSLTDRTGLPRRRPLLRVILDGDLRTPPDSRLFHKPLPQADAPRRTGYGGSGESHELAPHYPVPAHEDPFPVVIFCAPSASHGSGLALQHAGARILRVACTSGRLDLQQVLSALTTLEIRSVLLESGATLNAAFLAADLVDRVVLYYSETELGPQAVPFAADGSSPFELQKQLAEVSRATFPRDAGEDVRISGYLHDPWPA